MLKILTVPNKTLSTSAKPVGKIDSRIRRLLEKMEALLMIQDDPPGVGLAAPQVGVPIRLFIIKATPKAKTEVFINPRIGQAEMAKGEAAAARQHESAYLNLDAAGRKPPVGSDKTGNLSKNSKLEGCLSIPRIWAQVRRQKTVKLSYLDREGKEQTASFGGFKAIIIQHEVDHLEGILFTQRALEQGAQIYEEDGEGKLKKIDY